MSSKYFNLALLLLFVGALSACKEGPPAPEIAKFQIIPPIPDLDPAYHVFEVDAAKGGTFSLKNGTSITLPPNAFADQTGNSIQGKVNLRYREFHDAASIYLSGIPMHINVEGQEGILKTAGMFELKAEQNGENLALASGKKANVRMASWESGKDYNFYKLGMEDGNWADLGQKDPEVNTRRVQLKKEIKQLKPSHKFPLGKDYFTFTFSAFLDVYYNHKLKNVDKDLVENLIGDYGLGYTNVRSREIIVYNGKKVPAAFFIWQNLSGKAIPKPAKMAKSQLTDLGNYTYKLLIQDKDDNELWSGKVKIYMSIKSLLAFPPEHWQNNYEGAMASIRKKQAAYRLEASVFRGQEIMELGIYNWDKIWKAKESVNILAQFDLGEQPPIVDQSVVFISGDSKTVVRFAQKDWPKLRLIKDKNARIFTLLPDNKILLYSAKKYNKIDFAKLKKEEKPSFVFDMKGEEYSIASEKDMRKVLGI